MQLSLHVKCNASCICVFFCIHCLHLGLFHFCFNVYLRRFFRGSVLRPPPPVLIEPAIGGHFPFKHSPPLPPCLTCVTSGPALRPVPVWLLARLWRTRLTTPRVLTQCPPPDPTAPLPRGLQCTPDRLGFGCCSAAPWHLFSWLHVVRGNTRFFCGFFLIFAKIAFLFVSFFQFFAWPFLAIFQFLLDFWI